MLVLPTANKSICKELEKETRALFVLAIVLSNMIMCAGWPTSIGAAGRVDDGIPFEQHGCRVVSAGISP